MFETIKSILCGDLQPWLKKDSSNDNRYQHLMFDEETTECENSVYDIKLREIPYEPPMVIYYQRLILNDIHGWLNTQWKEVDTEMTKERAHYRQTELMNIFDELLSHTEDIIVSSNYSMSSVSGNDVSFATDTHAKICTLICYNLQAILITAFLTWQDYYKDFLPHDQLFDSPKQMAFRMIKHALPDNIEIARREEVNPTELEKLPKFFYIKSDNPKEIKDIETTIMKYITDNSITELCRFLKENEGNYFLVLPKKADVVYNELTRRWGDKMTIRSKSFRIAWSRIF